MTSLQRRRKRGRTNVNISQHLRFCLPFPFPVLIISQAWVPPAGGAPGEEIVDLAKPGGILITQSLTQSKIIACMCSQSCDPEESCLPFPVSLSGGGRGCNTPPGSP